MRSTLVRLCVTEQKRLTRVGRLELPCCRDLLLNANGIEELEDLSGCPRVQRLWLWSNRLTSVRGLGGMAELKELWVQDNRVSSLRGLEALPSLQAVNAAGNPIATLADLDRLAHIPALRSLSLDDPHFGPCPVAAARGYRDMVVLALPRLRQLDGRPVPGAERDAAVGAAAARAGAFAADVSEALSRHAQDVLEAEARRRAAASTAEAAHAQLSTALSSLEAAVRKGVAAVEAEADRQHRIRAAATGAAVAAVREAASAHADRSQERRSAESAAAASRSVLWRWVGLEAADEEAASGALREAVLSTAGGLVGHELSPHSPDRRALEAAVAQGWGGRGGWLGPAFKVARPASAVSAAAGRAGEGAEAAAAAAAVAAAAERCPFWVIGAWPSLLAAAAAQQRAGPRGAVLAASSPGLAAEVLRCLSAAEAAALLSPDADAAALLGDAGVSSVPALVAREVDPGSVTAACGTEEQAVDATAAAAWLRGSGHLSPGSELPPRLITVEGADGSSGGHLIVAAASWLGPRTLPELLVRVREPVRGDVGHALAAAFPALAEAAPRPAAARRALELAAAADVQARLSAVSGTGGGAGPEPEASEALRAIAEAMRRGAIAVAAGKDPDARAAAGAAAARAEASDGRVAESREAISAAKAAQDAALRAAARAASGPPRRSGRG